MSIQKECYECRAIIYLKRMNKIFWICVDCIDGRNYYQCNTCGDYYNDNDTSIIEEHIKCDYCN